MKTLNIYTFKKFASHVDNWQTALLLNSICKQYKFLYIYIPSKNLALFSIHIIYIFIYIIYIYILYKCISFVFIFHII